MVVGSVTHSESKANQTLVRTIWDVKKERETSHLRVLVWSTWVITVILTKIGKTGEGNGKKGTKNYDLDILYFNTWGTSYTIVKEAIGYTSLKLRGGTKIGDKNSSQGIG